MYIFLFLENRGQHMHAPLVMCFQWSVYHRFMLLIKKIMKSFKSHVDWFTNTLFHILLLAYQDFACCQLFEITVQWWLPYVIIKIISVIPITQTNLPVTISSLTDPFSLVRLMLGSLLQQTYPCVWSTAMAFLLAGATLDIKFLSM